MRCIVGEVHRQKILSFLRPGGRMLEWGSGGSTLWFADHLPYGASLVSVEHDPAWHAQVVSRMGPRDNVSLFLREARAALGRNATIEEEDPAPLTEYINAGHGQRFDVVLVDGYARGACIDAARDLLSPGGVIFLHDSQRPWYDDAKRSLSAWGTVGSCLDYQVPQLWYGAPRPLNSDSAGDDPVVVSYYTAGTPYEDDARRLIASCQAQELTFDVDALPAGSSWEQNCARKADVCLAAWHRHRRPIVWVDADAQVLAPLRLLRGCSADFAVHRWQGWQMASGTAFFNQTPLALELLTTWADLCRRDAEVWDQVSLDLAWEAVTALQPLDTLWLPQTYCQIFDAPRDESLTTVVEHHQASRRLKQEVSHGPSRSQPVPSEALMRARRASRTRRWMLPGADSQDFEIEVAMERSLDLVEASC